MYLNKKIYVGANYAHNEVTGEINLKRRNKPVKVQLKRISEIVENVAYWRKSNAIHKWFVDNVQKGEDDCGEYYVSEEQMKALIAACKTVLSDHSKAHDVLPTRSGFFFGGTDYDEWYFKGLEQTIEQLEPLLAKEEQNGGYYYSSSW